MDGCNIGRVNDIVTIIIGIIVAIVSLAIAISVLLGRILHRLAVVTRISMYVLVTVLLANVWDQPTVVLVQR